MHKLTRLEALRTRTQFFLYLKDTYVLYTSLIEGDSFKLITYQLNAYLLSAT